MPFLSPMLLKWWLVWRNCDLLDVGEELISHISDWCSLIILCRLHQSEMWEINSAPTSRRSLHRHSSHCSQCYLRNQTDSAEFQRKLKELQKASDAVGPLCPHGFASKITLENRIDRWWLRFQKRLTIELQYITSKDFITAQTLRSVLKQEQRA